MFVNLLSVRSVCLFLSLYLCISFFFKFYLLIIFGCAGSLLLHGFFSSCGQWGLLFSRDARTSGGDFSSCGVRAPGCSDFCSCGFRALEHRLASCGLISSVTCGIFPDQGLNVGLLH